MDRDELTAYAIRAAIRASEVIMDVYKSGEDLGIETKPDNTPVTRADMASNEAISEMLAETGLPILSEESAHERYSIRREQHKMWVVDPLDGTKEFIKRNDMFSVCIALVEEHRATTGVIAIPATSTIYYTRGGRAYRSEYSKEGELRQETQLPVRYGPTPHMVVSSVSHPTQISQDVAKRVEGLWPDVALLGVGSSIKQCMIAEGTAALYPRIGTTMEWDTAAGQAIIEAAGGRLLDMTTRQPMTYNRAELKNPPFLAIAEGVEEEAAECAMKAFEATW